MNTQNETLLDADLEDLARHLLKEAFYADFSTLVNKYEDLADGLNHDMLMMQLQEMSSVFGRDESMESNCPVNLSALHKDGRSESYDRLIDALLSDVTEIIFLQGKPIFKRDKGEWFLVHSLSTGEQSP